MTVNGEAIYGTRPWKVYGEGPTEVISGGFTDASRAGFTARDVRFTTQGDTLYAILLGMPESEAVVIESLGSVRDLWQRPIQQIELLGTDAPITWSQTQSGLRISASNWGGTSPALVLKIR